MNSEAQKGSTEGVRFLTLSKATLVCVRAWVCAELLSREFRWKRRKGPPSTSRRHVIDGRGAACVPDGVSHRPEIFAFSSGSVGKTAKVRSSPSVIGQCMLAVASLTIADVNPPRKFNCLSKPHPPTLPILQKLCPTRLSVGHERMN